MDRLELEHKAKVLIQHLVNGCKNLNLGSLTLAIYDTAWVSMISKTIDGKPQWLFPECFQFLLDNQLPDGGWESYASEVDGVLNTMAALLAMKKHSGAPDHAGRETPVELETRISKATAHVQDKLQHWDIEASMHVGFEILVPALLSMLEQEKIYFTFPGQRSLAALNERKLGNFDPRILYGTTSTTLLHSLEAFVGKVDFNQVSHHKTFGSMMASPSSTAAYLMNCSSWDVEAEMYIRNAITHGGGNGSGGLPSAFPCNIFELTWVASTLLQAGFSVKSLGDDGMSSIGSYVEKHFHAQDGLLGFAPSVLPDADDTAKAILTLNLLGRPASPNRMITYFKAKDGHLMTYLGERNSSFSANCNALKALLHVSDVHEYAPQISSITTFLCDAWWEGAVKDKWNLSPQYSMMLLAAALMRLLHLWDAGQLEALPQQLVQDRMPVVLMQILNRTLLTQSSQGSWGPKDSSEVTAYAVLTLTTLSSLPCARLLKTEIDSATKVGRQILSQSKNNWAKPQYIWVEKVTYGSAVLSQAYCLAAMNAPTSSNLCGDRMERIMSVPTKALIESARFFSRLNRFSKEPEWKLKASILEGHLFFLQLQSAPLEIFPPQERAKAENLKYIPYAWMIINNCEAIFLDALLLWDMMVLSMLDCLVDEYMESVVALLSEDDLKSLREIIRVLCEEPGARKLQTRKLPHPEDDFTGLSNKDWIHPTKVHVGGQFEHLPTVKAVLARYVKAIHDHIRVQHASSFDQLSLHAELRTFLLSHIVQIQDNARFSRQQFHCADVTTPFLTPRTSYYTWTHTTAAEHTSCHFSFAFYACLLGSSFGERADCFSSVYQKYLARDLCSHLGVMIRLYSDYASILRDHANFNLNSINFPEFHYHPREHRAQGENSEAKEMRLETTLMDLAQYERDCVSMVAERLMKDLGTGLEREKRTANAVTLYVCVTELYADMFVANDMS